VSSTNPAKPTGKGHATPTRKQAQAARQRPLVQNDRKAAKAAAKARRDEAFRRQQEAMVTGDDRWLPVRDKGRARRFARDYVDARWSVGELFLPMAFLILFVMVIGGRYPEIALTATALMYIIIVGAILDSLIMVRFLKKHLAARFTPAEIPPWTGAYAFQRVFMLRRFRMPKPQNKRGEWPQRQAADVRRDSPGHAP